MCVPSPSSPLSWGWGGTGTSEPPGAKRVLEEKDKGEGEQQKGTAEPSWRRRVAGAPQKLQGSQRGKRSNTETGSQVQVRGAMRAGGVVCSRTHLPLAFKRQRGYQESGGHQVPSSALGCAHFRVTLPNLRGGEGTPKFLMMPHTVRPLQVPSVYFSN